jgi:LysM repeat protein
MTTCPICGLERIRPDKTHCPQCDADLTCFKVLDSLPNESVNPVREKTGSRKQVILFAAIALFFGLTSVLSLVHMARLKRLESRVLDQQTYAINALINMDVKLDRLSENHSKPLKDGPAAEVVSETGEDVESLNQSSQEDDSEDNMEFWTYEAHENDTLWGIAKRYYGSGDYYPVLIDHNSHLEIYDIGDGVRMRILKDAGLAKEIYKEVTESKGNTVYFKYTVAKGDTLRSLAKKFYKTGYMVERITDLNPEMKLEPGKRIKILLE